LHVFWRCILYGARAAIFLAIVAIVSFLVVDGFVSLGTGLAGARSESGASRVPTAASSAIP